MYLLERQPQLEALNRCFREACAACGKLVLLAGGAGLGKSALVERFVSDHRRDARTLWGACDSLSTPRALAPVHDIAAQTVGLAGRVTYNDEACDWLFRVLLEDLARPERPCVAVLEDVHWADAATLDFVRFVGRRIQRTSAVVVVTYRDDELPASHPLRLVLGELTGDHVVRIRLAPLTLAGVEVLARESGREAGARGLLEMQTDSVGFRHELARLAVLSSIEPVRLRGMHAQVLEPLMEHDADPARLVHHAALAENAAAVLEFAPQAAEKAARLGAHREAAAHLSAALRYGASLTQALRAEILEDHAQESALANQTREAIASGTAAAACWRELGNVEAQSRVLRLLVQEYRTAGEKVHADESVTGAIAVLEALPRSADMAMAYGTRSLLALSRGWNREALEFGQRALELALEVGDRAAESYALCHIGGALLGTGDRAGYEHLESSLALALEHRLEDHAARAYRTLQFYAGLVHDFARAEQAFHEGVEYCEERGIFSHSAYIRAYYTMCELDRGNWTEAAQTASELLRGSEVTGVTQRVTVMTTLALVRVRRGDPGADELLDEALRLALPTAEVSRIARAAAARAWARIGMPYEQALALAEGPEGALREALGILDGLGAGPLAAVVRRRLRERGARSIPRGPHAATRANPAGLTSKELQVLRLLTQGCTSAELALRLHRSPKTVDHHVSSLLEKLGVHSRAEAVAAAFGRGMLGTLSAAPRQSEPNEGRVDRNTKRSR